MSNTTRFFGSNIMREISDSEIQSVSGGVILGPGDSTETNTGTDDGYSCDADSDYAMGLG